MTSLSATPKRPAGNPLLLIAGILCIATALRAPVTGVPPLIGMIREQLALNSTAAGRAAMAWSAPCSRPCC
jgi:CP family cyanate transporter-like MFS transporter